MRTQPAAEVRRAPVARPRENANDKDHVSRPEAKPDPFFSTPEPEDDGPKLRSGSSTRIADRAAIEDYIARLAATPYKNDFFQAIRRLEAMHPQVPGFGASSRAAEDPVRFCQEPNLAFAPCTVSELRYPTGDKPARLFVHFLGLLGPNGPLPLHLTEYARERERHHKDSTFARFLDVFNHRLLSLFYRAWAVNQMPASFDRWEAPPPPTDGSHGDHDPLQRELLLARDRDRYAIYIGSLFGYGMDALRHRDALPDTAKLHFSGRLSMQQRNPEGLVAILHEYFGLPVEIEEFSGRWVELPRDYHTRLGGANSPSLTAAQRSSATLGGPSGGAVAGRAIWDCGGSFRLRLGPMTLEEYQRLLPGTASHKRLSTWIRTYVGDEFFWEAVLILKKEEVPKTMLGEGARLGWTTWIRSEASQEDRADLALRAWA